MGSVPILCTPPPKPGGICDRRDSTDLLFCLRKAPELPRLELRQPKVRYAKHVSLGHEADHLEYGIGRGKGLSRFLVVRLIATLGPSGLSLDHPLKQVGTLAALGTLLLWRRSREGSSSATSPSSGSTTPRPPSDEAWGSRGPFASRAVLLVIAGQAGFFLWGSEGVSACLSASIAAAGAWWRPGW